LTNVDKWSSEGVVMSIRRRAQSGKSIVPRNRFEEDESVDMAARSPRLFVSIWESTVFIVFVTAAGALGLTRFASHVGGQDQDLASSDQPGGGIIIRSEVLRVWLPPALLELAKREPPVGTIRNHEAFRRFLEIRRQEKVWYAIAVRGYQANGDIVDMPFVRRPYGEPRQFPELLEMLAIATVNSSGDPMDKPSTTLVSPVPERLLRRDPLDAIAELLDDPAPRLNAECTW
jgi:hypothetical protein